MEFDRTISLANYCRIIFKQQWSDCKHKVALTGDDCSFIYLWWLRFGKISKFRASSSIYLLILVLEHFRHMLFSATIAENLIKLRDSLQLHPSCFSRQMCANCAYSSQKLSLIANYCCIVFKHQWQTSSTNLLYRDESCFICQTLRIEVWKKRQGSGKFFDISLNTGFRIFQTHAFWSQNRQAVGLTGARGTLHYPSWFFTQMRTNHTYSS